MVVHGGHEDSARTGRLNAMEQPGASCSGSVLEGTGGHLAQGQDGRGHLPCAHHSRYEEVDGGMGKERSIELASEGRGECPA